MRDLTTICKVLLDCPLLAYLTSSTIFTVLYHTGLFAVPKT